MGDFLNWIALLGVGLIVGGLVLLTSAITGARRARRRTGRARRSARLAESAPYRRLEPRMDRAPGAGTPRPTDIRRSALLAETVTLAQLTPPPPVAALQGPTLPLITVDWNHAGRPPR